MRPYVMEWEHSAVPSLGADGRQSLDDVLRAAKGQYELCAARQRDIWVRCFEERFDLRSYGPIVRVEEGKNIDETAQHAPRSLYGG